MLFVDERSENLCITKFLFIYWFKLVSLSFHHRRIICFLRTFLRLIKLLIVSSLVLSDIGGTCFGDLLVHELELRLSDIPHEMHDTHAHDLAGDLSPIVLVLLARTTGPFLALPLRVEGLLDNSEARHVQLACDGK